MSEKIEPALTPEEWAVAIRDRAGMAAALQKAWGDGANRENDHQLAALSLIFQPFGFTHQDVEMLRREADIIEQNTPDADDVVRYRNLAARIAALLPPEP